jgi:hypothetical protein
VKVVLHAGAAADLTSAGDWYESQRPGLGLELRDEIARGEAPSGFLAATIAITEMTGSQSWARDGSKRSATA